MSTRSTTRPGPSFRTHQPGPCPKRDSARQSHAHNRRNQHADSFPSGPRDGRLLRDRAGGALALVDAGFAVVGTSRNAANAEPLAGVTFLDLDVASDESVRSLVEEVIERFGRIDVLVNNAGVGAVGAGEEARSTRPRRSSTSTSSA